MTRCKFITITTNLDLRRKTFIYLAGNKGKYLPPGASGSCREFTKGYGPTSEEHTNRP